MDTGNALSSVSNVGNVAPKKNIAKAFFDVYYSLILLQQQGVQNNIDTVQNLTDQISKSNQASSIVGEMLTSFGDTPKSSDKYSGSQLSDFQDALKAAGLPAMGDPVTYATLKAKSMDIDNSKSSMSNQSNLDMVTLQSAMSQATGSVTALTNFLKSNSDSQDGVSRNL